MKKITYKEIAEIVKKNEGTIKNWKNSHPELLELVKLGALCKKNNITVEKIQKCIEVFEITNDKK